MADSPEWTEEALSGHYADGTGIDLGWLDKPSRHQFRWRSLKGPWITARRRISSGKALTGVFEGKMPTDVYVSTSSWLDPVNLPRLKDTGRPTPILLGHMVVFDIDMRPFCISRLEKARKAALRLRNWLLENTDLEIQHVSFSGSKGFHLVAHDPDRSLFAEPDPAKREDAVRKQRKSLLDSVIEAGHPVDPVVTADTRRIIRLPGTVHGSTGWECTILEEGWLECPVAEWVNSIPRHPMAVRLPARPPISLPRLSLPGRRKKRPRKQADHGPEYASLEVSSHVAGTKDRSAVVTWLPSKWGGVTESIEKAQVAFDAMDIGPVAYLHDGERGLAIVPRAIPRDFLMARLPRAGLHQLSHEIRRFDHSWVRVTGKMDDDGWEGELEPITVLGYETSERCLHPWSAPHLELCKRLGLPIRQGEGDVAGNSEASIRVAVRR